MKICDLTQFYSPLGGGVKRYISDKQRHFEKETDLEHVLIIPSARDRRRENTRSKSLGFNSRVDLGKRFPVKLASRCSGRLPPEVGPGILAVTLLVELVVILVRGAGSATAAAEVGPREVALSLFGTYAIGVELASFLLLAGLVGAARLGSGTRSTGGES